MKREAHITTNDHLTWLLEWYDSQCDGDWEHGNGIRMGTLDNPGWYLRVSIKGTECKKKEFKDMIVERSENDWIHCFIEDKVFKGASGPFNLPEIFQIFRAWAEEIQ